MIKVNGDKININYFPDGSLNLNIDNPHRNINIEWYYEPNEEIVLFYIANHIINNGGVLDNLYMPYIPNARQDRAKKLSNVFTLKYFCNFINSLNFKRVIVRDAHSNVALSLINNVAQDNFMTLVKELMSGILINNSQDRVFYPDEGSCKRYSEDIKFPYIFGIKDRDWDTGKIKGLDVYGNIPNVLFNVLIVDDIISYGGTIFYSAKKLKEIGANKIYVYTTHCENSILEGELIGSGLINKIYTTKSIFTKEHDLIQVLEDNNV